MSLWVRPDVLPKAPAELLASGAPVLWMLERGGLADRIALNLVCRRFGLPDPGAVLHYGGVREKRSVDVLQRRSRGPFGKPGPVVSQRLERLVEAALDDAAGDLAIVPVAIYWGWKPARETSALGIATGENWHIGSRIGKLLRTMVHGRNTLVRFSEPLSLRVLVTGERPATATPASLLPRKLARILRVHFRQRRAATLGPDQSHRRTLIDRVLADEGVRRAMEHERAAGGKGAARVRARAERDAYEIAADVSYPTIRLLDRFLTRLWTELYDGIELAGIERLQALADTHELVYVPCHRSHVDYLLLSWLLVKEGFSLPHVAAGMNLNLPVVGGVLRRGGAFFLRRSFAGDPLYGAVFAAYLGAILRRGNALEYFIEGGRSRTGRLLPAKGGMLAMTAHAWLRQGDATRRPVAFVPVWFGYERLLEGRSFTSELTGAAKRKESLAGLLRSVRSLRENYGRVHVSIGEPIMLTSLVDAHRPGWREETFAAARPGWLKALVDELGLSILRRINEAASVTPTSLLATAMLATRRGRLGRDELARQIALYARLLASSHADSLVVVPPIVACAEADAVITHGVELGYLEITRDAIGELVTLREGQGAPLGYFRNNILHLLTLPALLASAFTSLATRSEASLRALVEVALPFLHGELFLPGEPGPGAIERALAALEGEGLLRREGGLWRRARAGTPEAVELLRLAEVVLPTMERYYLCAALLVQAEGRIDRAELDVRSSMTAERLAATEGRAPHELHDRHLLRGFVDALLARSMIELAGDGSLTPAPRLTTLEGEARRLLDDGIRHAILRASLACTAARAGSDASTGAAGR